MNHIKKILLLLFICGSFNSHAQFLSRNLWKKNNLLLRSNIDASILPRKYDIYELDLDAFQNQLNAAPLRFDYTGRTSKPVINIPNTKGEFIPFEIVENPVLHPRLAAKYPNIHSYLGVCTNNPNQTIRFDTGPSGFHGMILESGHSPIFINPASKDEKHFYIVFDKSNAKRIYNLECLANMDSDDEKTISQSKLRAGDCDLRTYRLALSCTGEYAQYHGGTKEQALAAMNTTMTRVNGIYERDLGIKMEIVANNDTLIYLDGSSDPFSNNSANALINENQNICDSKIGINNYDIGHCFSTGAGGLAAVGCVCHSNKAKGVTGSPSPVGDPYDIDYVCHEMGHQFGARHTFNNSCVSNRANNSAVEPGSGSTIMGYAGICPPNVQMNSDAYFHSLSIIQIKNYIGSTFCASPTSTGNNPPVLATLADYVIPNSTPFELEASATDADGDLLSYCWEQIDYEIATMPPESTSTGGPAFRSLAPALSPIRIFPKLSSILTNTTTQWEVLPSVARSLNFRCMVRDNHIGAGCTDEDEMTITVVNNSNPFKVNSPFTNVTWEGMATKEITWDVANTNQAPVNATSVDILLSTDGGLTFPITLASNEVNDGSAMIVVPNDISSTTCRIKIKPTNNIFFDINDVNFTIQPAVVSTFFMAPTPSEQSVCTVNSSTTNYSLAFTTELGFSESIQLTLTGLPSGMTYSFSSNNFTPPSTITLSIENITPASLGNHTLTVHANSASVQKTIDLNLEVLAPSLAQATLVNPANGTSNLTGIINLSWNSISNTKNYIVDISTNPSFPSESTTSFTSIATNISLNMLEASTPYYWRVRGSNSCVFGDYSETFSFQTGGISCTTYSSNDTQKNIPSGVTTSSVISIVEDYPIYDLNVSIDVAHSWVGDLSSSISGPDNTDILLFDRPGIPASTNGCGQDDLNVIFDDEAVQTAAQLESTCTSNSDYAISGSFQPIQSLAAYENKTIQGDWSLNVVDAIAPDEGMLNSWELNVCHLTSVATNISLINNDNLSVPENQTEFIQELQLKTTSTSVNNNDITYTLLSPPLKGDLKLNSNLLGIGDIFTQSDINAGRLSYTNTVSGASDFFHFDVKDNLVGWLGNKVFNINIIPNNLIVTADITTPILCNGNTNGAISVQVSGGTSPYQYSKNGTDFQSSNIFGDLAASTYQFTVKDANNLIATVNKTLSQPNPLMVDYSLNGNNATISATGGVSPYLYSIDNQNYQSTNIFSLPNGQSTLYVKDANNCVSSIVAVVSVNNIVLDYTTQAISCNNESDGEITISATGGTAPYMYSIDNGNNYQSSNIFTNLNSGTYNILVQDAGGFLKQISNIVLDNPLPIPIDVVISGKNISINPVGAYTYAVDNTNFQTSNTFSNISNGNHIAYIKNNLGCQNEKTFTINVKDITLNFTKTDVLCFGDQTGEIIATATGNGVLMFSLNNGSFQTSNTFSNLATGNYTLKVTDELGFSKEVDIEITSPSPLDFTTTIDGNSITIFPSGGVPDYTYSVEGVVNFQNNATIQNIPNGTHTVKVKDSNGCQKEKQFEISNSISASITTQNINCNGGMDGEISVSVIGGTAPYYYSINGGSYGTNNTFPNLSAGTYQIAIKDANNVKYSSEVTLTEPDAVEIIVSSLYDKIVIDNSGNKFSEFSLDGSNWQSSNEFLSKNVGNYTIYAKQSNGCIATKSYFHDFQLLGGMATQIVSCESFKGIEVIAFGGLAPYQYSVDGDNWQDSKVFTDIESTGKVNFYIKDALNHQFHGQINLKRFDLLKLEVVQNSNSIELTATGGNPPYEYSIDGENWQESNVFVDLASNNYTAIVRDQDGCTRTYAFTIVGVNNLVQFNNLSIHPNPNTGNFVLKLSGDTKNEITISVFNVIGQCVFNERFVKTNTVFELPMQLNSGSGVFQIRVTDGQHVGVVRVVVR